jgi:Fe-S-cluster containining protein
MLSPMQLTQSALENYRLLRERVDTLCRHIEETFSGHLACKAGCHDCCRHLSLFPVEALALAVALHQLPPAEAEGIRQRAAATGAADPCPLLAEGLCLLYAARPLICRTHGLPILATAGETRRVDFCPRNFRQLTSLPGDAVIDLDRLNASLCAVNALFITQCPPGPLTAGDRLTIAEALCLELREP